MITSPKSEWPEPKPFMRWYSWRMLPNFSENTFTVSRATLDMAKIPFDAWLGFSLMLLRMQVAARHEHAAIDLGLVGFRSDVWRGEILR